MGKAVDLPVSDIVKVMRRFERGHMPLLCGVEGCGRPHRTLNVCVAHYLRVWKFQKKHPEFVVSVGGYPFADVDAAVQPVMGHRAEAFCHVVGCSGKHVGRGLCRKHYQVWWRKNNEFVVES